MPYSAQLLHHRHRHPPRRLFGWLLLLALSLLLHLLLLAAIDGRIGMPTALPKPTIVTATLSATLTAAAPPATAIVATPQLTPAPPKPRPVRRKPVAVPAQIPTAPAEPVLAAADVPPAPAAADRTTTNLTPEESVPTPPAAVAAAAAVITDTPAADPVLATTAATVSAPPVPPSPPAPQYKISLPPPATLAYEVRYATRGSITRGSGVIAWQVADAGSYTIRGEVSKFGFTLSSFRSEGRIDATGIAPVLYAEKNARLSETNTHFLRDARQVISFSASTDSYPLAAGSQDRSSILWQLAGIAGGDPTLLVPGTMFDIFVAGVREAEHWIIEVAGEETISIETGEVRAWHLIRAPRPGSYDKRLDIWLAPALQWYPVKLRYTEASGDYLDLSLSAVR